MLKKERVFMGSKDTYPKGSEMNIISQTPFGAYWIKPEECA